MGSVCICCFDMHPTGWPICCRLARPALQMTQGSGFCCIRCVASLQHVQLKYVHRVISEANACMQVIFGLHELHSAGLWHGRLLPRTVLLGGYLHVWLAGACFLPCKTDPEQSLAELTAKWHSWEVSPCICVVIMDFEYLLNTK